MSRNPSATDVWANIVESARVAGLSGLSHNPSRYCRSVLFLSHLWSYSNVPSFQSLVLPHCELVDTVAKNQARDCHSSRYVP